MPSRRTSRGRKTRSYTSPPSRSTRARGQYRDPALGKQKLSSFWPEFLEKSPHLRASTVEHYSMLWRRYIAPKLGPKSLASITRADVESWIAGLVEDGVGDATINAAHRVLRRVLAVAEASDIVTRNVARGVKTPRPPREEMRFLSASELAVIADAVPDRDRALVLLLGLGGLRIGEALAIKVEDLDLLRRTVKVTKAATEIRGRVEIGMTKTGKSRAVPLPRVVAEALSAHLAAFPAARDGLVFTAPEGGAIRRTNWRRRAWAGALSKADIAEPLPRVHDLRHTAATLAIQAGAHPKAIQEMLGHSSITVTLDRYGHLFPSLAEELAERVDALFPRQRDDAKEPKAL